MASVETERQAEAASLFLDAYSRMLLIRLFETSMHRLFLEGEVHGTTHLYAGQEAVAVGTCLALSRGDYVAGTYRGHGHALAKGTAPGPLIAEMLGRAQQIRRVCTRHGLPIGAVALQFTLRHQAVTAAVIGARSPAEISEDVRYLGIEVPDSVFDELAGCGLIAAHARGAP